MGELASQKRVLVTGATGFIGSHTVRPLLQRGYEVHAVSSKPAPASDTPVIWHQADLFDNAYPKLRPIMEPSLWQLHSSFPKIRLLKLNYHQ